MRLQGNDGVIAQFVAWNLSSNDQSYVVVALGDGQLQEWKLNDCRIVEERKTSDAAELAATTANTQMAAAEVAELVVKKITPSNKPSAKCQCGADAVYHYCRICWCMEIDSQKQADTSHVG